MNSTRTLRLAAPCALILLAAAPGLAQDGVIAEQAPGAALASTLMDARVVSAAGEAIGDVEDLIVGPDGRIAGVVVGVGGFLDVGEKDVAFEMARLERATGEGGGTVFVLGASAAELGAAPEFRSAVDRRQARQAAGSEGPAGTGEAPREQID